MNISIPDDLKLHVFHLHRDNSTRKQRENSPYRTIARLICKSTEEVIAEASAKCHSQLDQPNRKIGYELAVRRVLCKVLGLNQQEAA